MSPEATLNGPDQNGPEGKADVWVLAQPEKGDFQKVTLELFCEGQRLADRLGGELAAVLFGKESEELVHTMGLYGVDKAYFIEDPNPQEYSSDNYANLLTDLVRKYKPAIFLAGQTPRVRDFFPRVAARAHMGFASEYTRLKVNREKAMVVSRPIYGGRLEGTYTWSAGEAPFLALTIRPGTVGVEKPSRQKEVKVINVDASPAHVHTRIINFTKGDPRTMDIREAEVIVSVGKGIGSAENMASIRELAEMLGASIACSRRVLDAGWLPRERLVGQTGKTVSPRLYVACGISGAAQHTHGMNNSKHIIAINTDSGAPIFRQCDVGIIGDVNEVVPKLVACLRRLRESGTPLGPDNIIRHLS